MKIAVAGLGRMGMQIARKLSEDGHTVIAHNRSKEPVDEAVGYGAVAAYAKEDVPAQFTPDETVILWLMVPSDVVDAELETWLSLLPKNSIVIDGGNSDFRLTKKRAELVKSRGSALIDCGTSGGVWGYQNGFSMMVGGETAAVERLAPLFDSLSKPEGAWRHFGEPGSGHYVKMTHNAIEYGMMQSLAEGYRLLKEGPYAGLDLAAAGEVWQHHSVITSWLNELTRDALKENPELDGIDGFVAESGEARWAIETAREAGVPLPAIETSFDIRLRSQQGEVNFATKLLAAMRNKFGGHTLNK